MSNKISKIAENTFRRGECTCMEMLAISAALTVVSELGGDAKTAIVTQYGTDTWAALEALTNKGGNPTR